MNNRSIQRNAALAAFAAATVPSATSFAQPGTATSPDQQPPAYVQRAEQVTHFSTLDQLVASFNAGSHIYLHSTTALSSELLAAKERELAANHPNWFAFYIEDATNLTYRHAGKEYRGIDAVEAALEYGVRISPAFMSLVDSESGLRNGAYFAVVKASDGRTMIYNGLDHYDRYVSKEEFSNGAPGEPAFKVLTNDPGAYLEATDAAIKGVEAAVSSGEMADAAKPWVIGVPVGGVVLGAGALVGFGMRRRSRGAKDSAEEQLATVDRLLETKREERTEAMKEFLGLRSDSYTGETRHKMARAAALFSILDAIEEVVENKSKEAKTLISSGGAFGTENYRKAANLLSEGIVRLDPRSDAGKAISGKNLAEEGLTADFESFKLVDRRFTDLFPLYTQFAEEAKKILATVATARDQARTEIDKLGESTASLYSAHAKYLEGREEKDLFRLSPIVTDIVPVLQKDLEAASADCIADPVKAFRSCESIAKKLAVAREFLDEALNDLPGLLANTVDACDALEDGQQLKVDWISAELAVISSGCDEYLRSILAEKRISQPNIQEAISAVIHRARAISSLEIRRSEEGLKNVTELTEAAKERRAEILARIAPQGDEKTHAALDRIFEKDGFNPGVPLGEAAALLTSCHARLNTGNLKDAEADFNLAVKSIDKAHTIIAAAGEILASYDEWVSARESRLEELKENFGSRAEILATIKSEFDEVVLDLREGDPTHPSSDRTIGNNIHEVEQAAAQAAEEIAQSKELFSEGKLFAFRAAIEEVDGLHNFIEFSLDEIQNRRAELDKTDQANREVVSGKKSIEGSSAGLQGEASRLEGACRNRAVYSGTINTFRQFGASLEEAARTLEAGGRNPFATAKLLATLQSQAAMLASQITADIAEEKEATRSYYQAEEAWKRVDAVARESANDSHKDSDAIRKVHEGVPRMRSTLQRIQRELALDHGDWYRLNREADELFEQCSTAEQLLRNQINAAEAASRSVSEASSAIQKVEELRQQVARTPGSYYGATLPQEFGKELLAEAKVKRLEGDHASADTFADKAKKLADRCVENFHSDVTRRKREEERRIERERQRREEEARRAAQAAAAAAAAVLSQSRRSSSGSGSSFPSMPRMPSAPRPSMPSRAPSRPSGGGFNTGGARRSFGGGGSGAARRGF